MPSNSAAITVDSPPDTVFRYLKDRYDREAHTSASMAAKGYVPTIICTEELPNDRLSFRVRGRDPVLNRSIGGWTWTYELSPVDSSATRVQITYSWSFGMSLLGAGTTGHQAANEITETAMALDALGFERTQR